MDTGGAEVDEGIVGKLEDSGKSIFQSADEDIRQEGRFSCGNEVVNRIAGDTISKSRSSVRWSNNDKERMGCDTVITLTSPWTASYGDIVIHTPIVPRLVQSREVAIRVS